MPTVADPNDYETVANPNDYEAVTQSAPIIPRSGAQMESLGAREFLQTAPGEVRGTGDQPVIPIPRIPQQEGVAAQLGAGVVNIGSQLAEMAETPQMIAALPVAPARLTQLLFGGQALSDIKTAYEEAARPETTIQKGLELGGRALTDALFGVGMVHGAVGGLAESRGLISKPESLTESLFGKPEPIKPEPLSPVAVVEQAAREEIPNASQIPSTESVPVPEVRQDVGREAPLRQSGETTGAREGGAPEIAGQQIPQEVAPTEPTTPFGVFEQQLSKLQEMKDQLKARTMVYQADAKENAAALLGQPRDIFYNLPYEGEGGWREASGHIRDFENQAEKAFEERKDEIPEFSGMSGKSKPVDIWKAYRKFADRTGEATPLENIKTPSVSQAAMEYGRPIPENKVGQQAAQEPVAPEQPSLVQQVNAGLAAGEQPPLEPETATQSTGYPTVEVPLKDITLSKDVPQFKAGANEKGVVEPIAGKYERVGTAPVQLWQRTNGDLELISGRHRLDLAQRTGEESIPSQIHKESEGFDVTAAARLDAELNIRDNQGSTADYANYFKNSEVGQTDAEARGLLARSKGKAGFAIARDGSEDLFALHQSGRITDAQANEIASAAPGNTAAQQVGLKAALEGKSADFASNLIRAATSRTSGQPQTADLFAFDDSAMREMEAQAKRASDEQRTIREQISAVQGAAKKPALAAKLGVDVKDPNAVNQRVSELKTELSRWENWPTQPDLVAKTRGETYTPPIEPTPVATPQGEELFAPEETPFNLTAETITPPEETTAFGGETLSQKEMFGIQQITELKDPIKSADAAESIHGNAMTAANAIERQLRIIDSDPKVKSGFIKEQRQRLSEVVNLLRERAENQGPPEPGISGLEGQAMGAAGTRDIPLRGWKDMIDAGEQPALHPTAEAAATQFIGKVLDSVGRGFRNFRDFITVDPVPKLTRSGLADAAYEHASARNSVVHSVRHLLSRVFPDEYKNPIVMKQTGDILTKDNILGVYDQAKARFEATKGAETEPEIAEHDAAGKAVQAIEKAHDLEAYDRDVKAAMSDPRIADNIERWKTWVNPEMDRMYNELKGYDPWTVQEPRGRHFEARINLLPKDQAADIAKFTDADHAMPDIPTSNYRNPNVKRDPFMRRATGTGQYETDPGLILTNSLGRRWNEVTKIRFYEAIQETGNGFIVEPGERPPVTEVGKEPLVRMAIKVPETNPKTGMTRPVEKSLWIKKSLTREARDVLNTDMSAPSNPVFRGLTQIQLLQAVDMVAHMKNIHTVVSNSLGASKGWQDAIRKMPFLATGDAVGRIASVTHEVLSDTPAIRDEVARMAQQGMIRPSYPPTGIQKITRGQQAIHSVDTASRIVMNRFWDNLVERGMVNDSMQARRSFVNQIGEYNRRLLGHFTRNLRDYGASPFIVAGRTFNKFSKRLLTGDPGFKAATPQAGLAARAYQLSALTMATTVPAIVNYMTTGKFGGRPGVPIGAIDTGTNNDKGEKRIIDLMHLMGIRRGLRATGLGAIIEGVREGKSANLIGGKMIEDVTTTASHPWIGPGLGALYSGISGKRLDLRGGAWPYAAKQIKEGGLKQYAENLRVTLKNQNPLIYGLIAPIIGETEDTYKQGLAKGFLKAPMGSVGYKEVPSESAFSFEKTKSSKGKKQRSGQSIPSRTGTDTTPLNP